MEMAMMNPLFSAAGMVRPNAAKTTTGTEGQSGLFDLLLQGRMGGPQTGGEDGLGGEDLLKALMQALHPEGSGLQTLQSIQQSPDLDSLLQGLGEESQEVTLLLQRLENLPSGEKEVLWREFQASVDTALQERANLDPNLSEGRQQTLTTLAQMGAPSGVTQPQSEDREVQSPRVEGMFGSDIAKPAAKSHPSPAGGLSEKHLAQLATANEPSLRENQQAPTKVPFERAAESGAIPVEIRTPLSAEGKSTMAAAVRPEAFVQEHLSRRAEGLENLATIGSGGTSPVASTGSTSAPFSSNPLYLPSGQIVPEEQVIQQVTGRLALNRGEGISEMTLKLHPRELGEVRLELTVEKDHVRVNLLAQNHQVQDVLERHLPRLRQALETSGLKLDELQVGVDSRGGDGEHRPFQDQQRFAASRHWSLPRQAIPLGDLPSAASTALQVGGINLRI